MVTVLRHVDEPLSGMIEFTMPGKAVPVILAALAGCRDSLCGQVYLSLDLLPSRPDLTPGQVPYRLAGRSLARRQGSGFRLELCLRRDEAEFLAVTIDDILDGDLGAALSELPDKTQRSRARRALRDALAAIERALV
jgi:hypothetical protein